MRNILSLPALSSSHAYSQIKRFKGSNGFLNIFFGFLDISATLLSLYLAFHIRGLFFESGTMFSTQYYTLAIIIVPLWLLLLKTTNLATIPRTSRYLTILFNFSRFALVGFILLLLTKLIFGLHDVSFAVITIFSVLNLFLLYSIRILTFKFFKYYRAQGHNLNNVIIIADALSEMFIEKVLEQREWGFRLVAIVSDSKLIKAKYGHKLRVIPEKANIKGLIDVDIIDEVIYSKNRMNHQYIQSVINTCKEVGVVFRMQSDLSPISTPNTHLSYIEEKPFLTFMNTPSNGIALAWKSILDLLLSTAILLAISPILLVVAFAVRVDSPGPVIFKQQRVGLRGRKFYIYKFRTMHRDAEKMREKLMAENEMDGPVFKIKKDPRITRIGNILRKTGLDELPQLYNVVKGEMSLIGPRPPLPKEVEEYERWQLRRLSIKPGITCTWQIIPNRNDVLFEDWMKLDLKYIENWSLKEDFKLLIRTIKTVISGSGA